MPYIYHAAYVLVGGAWATHALHMQRRLYGKDTRPWQYVLLGLANLLLWPVAMIVAALFCMHDEERHDAPR